MGVVIDLIATHRDHGRRGHAKSLFNAINGYPCFKGRTQVLHVRAQDKAAKDFYRSLGFIEQAGHNKTYANGDIQLEYRREVAHNEAAKGLYRSLGFIEQAGHNKTYANGDIQLE